MKNIAIITSCLTNGGAERAAGLLSKALEDKYNVFTICISDLPITYEYGGTLLQLSMNKNYDKWKQKGWIFGKIISKMAYLHAILNLRKIKKIYKIDVSISFLDTPNLMNIFSKRKEKVIVSVRNNRSLQTNTRIQRFENWGIKKFYNFTDRVVAVSYGVAEDLIKNFNIKPELIDTIYNFYDFESLINKSKGNIPPDLLHLYKNNKVLVSMGRLVEQKNFENLIIQCHELFKNRKDVVLLILGRGELHGKLEKLIKELGEESRIILHDYVENPFPMIKNAEVFIINSIFEGICNSIFESFACKTLVISTDCYSGPREVLAGLREYDTKIKDIYKTDRGILVPLDSNKMLEALDLALDDQDYKKQCINCAFDYIKDFSTATIKQQWIDLIGKV